MGQQVARQEQGRFKVQGAFSAPHLQALAVLGSEDVVARREDLRVVVRRDPELLGGKVALGGEGERQERSREWRSQPEQLSQLDDLGACLEPALDCLPFV